MSGIDLFMKFNRGLCLALVDTDVFEAVQLYNQYLGYLNSLDKTSSNVINEIQKTQTVFHNKLYDFVTNEKNKEKLSEMIVAYKMLLEKFPENKSLITSCAECFKVLGQFDIALELIARVEKLSPDDFDIKNQIFELLISLKSYEAAKNKAEEIASKFGENFETYNILSRAYYMYYCEYSFDETYLKKAFINAELTYNANKKVPGALKNLINLCQFFNDFEKTQNLWQEYIKQNQLTPEDKFSYACDLFKMRKIKEAFKYYEARMQADFKKDIYLDFKKPFYQNFKGKCKTLLIQSEQGFGDTFMFSRYLSCIKHLADKIILRAPEAIIPILQRSFPYFEAIPQESTQEKYINYDCHLPIMSIPYVLGLDKPDTIFKEKYLFADPNKTKYFKEKYFSSNKFKICFSYEGQKNGLASRNIALSELKPLFDIEKAEFFAIQYGKNDDEFKGLNVVNLADEIKSFDDTAAIIENCNLVISVDNAVMNLAGAMDKKTYCIFNKYPEFRWYDLSGDDVKWYRSVKPYQTSKINEFEPVIEKMKKDIEGLIK